MLTCLLLVSPCACALLLPLPRPSTLNLHRSAAQGVARYELRRLTNSQATLAPGFRSQPPRRSSTFSSASLPLPPITLSAGGQSLIDAFNCFSKTAPATSSATSRLTRAVRTAHPTSGVSAPSNPHHNRTATRGAPSAKLSALSVISLHSRFAYPCLAPAPPRPGNASLHISSCSLRNTTRAASTTSRTLEQRRRHRCRQSVGFELAWRRLPLESASPPDGHSDHSRRGARSLVISTPPLTGRRQDAGDVRSSHPRCPAVRPRRGFSY